MGDEGMRASTLETGRAVVLDRMGGNKCRAGIEKEILQAKEASQSAWRAADGVGKGGGGGFPTKTEMLTQLRQRSAGSIKRNPVLQDKYVHACIENSRCVID